MKRISTRSKVFLTWKLGNLPLCLLITSLIVGQFTRLTAAATSAPPVGNNSYEFNGSTSTVEFPQVGSDISTLSVATFEFWARFDNPSGNYEIMNTGNSSTGTFGYGLGIALLNGKLIFSNNAWVNLNYSNALSLSTGAWHHIAIVYNNGYVSFYVDGNAAGGGPDQAADITLKDYSGAGYPDLRLGQSSNAALAEFDGRIDDLRIWGVDRTQSQIQANMSSELTGSESGLLRYWKFNELSGSISAEESAGSRDGSNTGIIYGNLGAFTTSAPCGPSLGAESFNGASVSLAAYGPAPKTGVANCWELTANGAGSGSMYWNGSSSPSNVNIVMQSATDISIKSNDGSEFDLNSFTSRWYTFSGSYTIEGYRDGNLVGSATGTASSSWTVTDLTPYSQFNNVDEIVLSGFSGSNVTFQLDEINTSAAIVGGAGTPVAGIFDFEMVSGSGTTVLTETVNGITATATSDFGNVMKSEIAVNGSGITSNTERSYDWRLRFDKPVDISAIQLIEFMNESDGAFYQLIPDKGTPISAVDNGAALSDFYENYTPTDWQGVSQIKVGYTGAFGRGKQQMVGLDYIQFTANSSANGLPYATGVSMSGAMVAGASLQGVYTYNDPEGDLESGTTYQWYRSDDFSGTNKSPIAGATAQSYSPVSADAGKYLSFEVTVNDGTDASYPEESMVFGPVFSSNSFTSIFSFDQGEGLIRNDAGFYQQDASGIRLTASTSSALSGDKPTLDDGFEVQGGTPVFTGHMLRASLPNNESLTVTFSEPVTVTSFNFGEFYDDNDGYNYSWTAYNGNTQVGTKIQLANNGAELGSDSYEVITPNDWIGITSITLSYNKPVGPNGYIAVFDQLEFQANINTSVNAAPTAANFTANTNPGEVYAFATADFSYADADNDPLDHIWINAIPAAGILWVDDNNNDAFDCNESILAANAQVSKTDLDAGYLKYFGTKSTATSFSFSANDATDYSASSYTATISPAATGVTVIDFENNGLADNTDFGADNLTSGNFKFTYSAGNLYGDGDDGADGSMGLFLAFVSGPGETLTIESTDGSEFDLRGFFATIASFDPTGQLGVEAFKNNVSVHTGTIDVCGAYSGGVKNYISLGSAFDDVDKVVITSGPYGYLDVFDDFVFGPAIPSSTPLSASISSQTNVSCKGGNDGKATVSASGGVSPYSYQWTPSGGTAATATGLSAGSYQVTVTDANNSTTTTSVNITEPAALLVQVTVDSNVSCQNGTDAGLTASVSGGTPPYVYSWTNGAATASVQGLTAGTYSVTVTDDNGCTASASDSVVIMDTIAPTVAVKNFTAYLNANGEASISGNDLDSGSTDNCVISNFILSQSNFDCSDLGENLVKVTAVDGAGNSSSSALQTLNFDEPFATRSWSEDGYNWNFSGWDNVRNYSSSVYAGTGGWMTSPSASGGLIAESPITVVGLYVNIASMSGDSATISAYDESDNLIQDTTLPGSSNFNYITLNWSNVKRLGVSFPYDYMDPMNTMDVFLDEMDYRTETFAKVTVRDTISPVAKAQPLTVYLDSNGAATITAAELENGSTDNCGIDTLILDQYQFGCADLGTQLVSFTAFDASGNSSVSQVSVEIKDSISPEATVNNVAVNTSYTTNGSAQFSSTYNLYVYNGKSVSFADPLPAGATITSVDVTYKVTASHLAHNRVQVAGTSIGDAYPGGSATYYTVNKSRNGDLPNYNYGGTNNFTLNSWWNSVTLTEVSLNFNYTMEVSGNCVAQVSVPMPVTSDNCSIASAINDYNNTSDASDSYPVGTTTVNWTITDTDSNSVNLTQLVSVTDNEAPTAVVNNPTLYLDANGVASISAADVDNGSSDNCAVDTMWLDTYSFSCADVGANNINVTVKDIHGNDTTVAVTVTVIDTINPVLNIQNINAYLDASGNASITAADIDNGSVDACGIDTVTLDQYQLGCAEVGANTVQLSATDVNGNTATATATVTVLDTISPSLSVKNVTAYLDASGNTSINATFIDNNTADNCGIDTLLLSQYDFDCSHVGANSVSFTATDVNGNSSATTVNVDVLDTISPVAQAQNLTVYLNADGNTSITAAQVNNASSDACGIDTLVLDTYNFTCAEVGANVVSLTAIDVNGNSTSSSASVTVVDSISPAVQVQDITVYLDQNGAVNITPADVDNGTNDACGIQQFLLSKTSFGCGELGPHMLTFSAEDVNGNIASAPVTVTVEDTIKPLAKTRNLLVYLDNNGQAVITPAMADNGSWDNCGFKLSLSQSIYGCADKGLNLESLTITDSTGNSATEDFLIEVRDTISPSLVTKNITVQLGATGQASIAASQLDAGSFDNCTNQLFFSASKTSFGCADLGVNTINVTVTDAEGNSTNGTATVIVEDNIKPVAQAQNLTVQLDASGMANITAAMANSGSSDNCSIDSIWVSQQQFSCADIGANSLQFSAMDQSGNIHTTNFVVTVEDNAAPVVATQNVTIQLNANGQASITTAMIDNGSNDNCFISSLTVDNTTFTCADLGNNTVTLTAVDQSGNTTSATATVTVEDNIAPSVLTQNITVQLDANGQAMITPAMIDNGSADNCSISSLTLDKSSFTCADLGNNTVSLTAVDQSGNTTSATATVLVEDNAAPVVATQNVTVQLDANGQASITPAMIDNGSADNCSISSLTLDQTSFTCADLGNNTVTLSAVDQSGNTTSATATVTVEDNIAPSVLAQNITVQLDANGQTVITPAMIDNGSADNCSISSVTLDQTSFTCAELGANTISLTAVDAAGNTTSATATITVEDNIAPSVLAQNITVQLDANGQAMITPAMIDNGSADNCNISNLSLDITSFDCTDIGNPVTVTLTATDQSSNSAIATAVVTVEDNMAPLAQTQNITVYLDASGSRTVLSSEVDNGSYDNCGTVTTSLDVSVFDCADLGQNLVNFTVADATGNSSQQTAFITVVDTLSPSIDNLPNAITAYAQNNQCATTVQWPAITASDNCSGVSVNTSQANGGLFSIGTTTVNVNVVDGSGNSISQSFDVIVLDTVSPVISGVPSSYSVNASATSCDAVVNWNAPSAQDNCAGVTMTSSHTPGSTFPVGNTVVTYTATDAYNNVSTVNFTVTVNDVIAPTIANVPANITQSADAGQCGAAVNFAMPVVADNCTGSSITSSHASGSQFPIGTTTVSFTATDAANNTTTASFTVTVEDKEAPKVTSVPASDTVGVCNAVYTYQLPVATDNCGGVSVTQIAGLPSGSIFPAGATQNSFRITDQYGNDTVVSFSIVVVPQGQPTLPSLIEICENAASVEMTTGQNLVWTGKGIVDGSVFDPAQAGSGRHQLGYTFTDGMGCSVSGSISVTVTPLPISPEIIQLASTTLGTKAAYTSYQWYRDGVMIPGATDPTYEYTQGGNYQVMVGNSFGCEVYGEGYVVHSSGGSIGLEEHDLNELALYPNPSTGAVTIDLKAQGERGIGVTVFSVEGKKVFEQDFRSETSGRIQLDLNHLPDATYFLYIRSRGEVEVRKLILY